MYYLLSCQACIQPQEQFSIPLLEVMPVNFVLLLIVDMVIIFGNLYLYKFLQQNTDRRKKGRTYCMKEDFPFISTCWVSVLQNLDVKKERRRNLIPARIGIYALIILVFFTLLHYITYSMPVDNDTRALLNAIVDDAYLCIVAPTIVLYGIPSVGRNMRAKYLSYFCCGQGN